MIVLLILSVMRDKKPEWRENKSKAENTHRTQNDSQEIHFDILFMARWFWKAIHAWKLNKKKLGTDRIIKSFLWKIEIMNMNKK